MCLNFKTGVPVVLADRSERFVGHLKANFFSKKYELRPILIGDGFRFVFVEKSLIDFERMVREKVA